LNELLVREVAPCFVERERRDDCHVRGHELVGDPLEPGRVRPTPRALRCIPAAEEVIMRGQQPRPTAERRLDDAGHMLEGMHAKPRRRHGVHATEVRGHRHFEGLCFIHEWGQESTIHLAVDLHPHRVLGRSGVRTAITESQSKYAVEGWMEEIVRSPLTFKAPAARDFALQRADALARDYVLARRNHFRVLFRQILAMLGLQVAASVALLGIGGVLVIRGELTLGQLVAAVKLDLFALGLGFAFGSPPAS